MPYRSKLIEVSLPLEAINAELAREKSIRHDYPTTLHLCADCGVVEVEGVGRAERRTGEAAVNRLDKMMASS